MKIEVSLNEKQFKELAELLNKNGDKVMATLAEVMGALDEVKNFAAQIDQSVEALHDIIKNGATEIPSAIGDQLLAKIAEIRAQIAVIQTDE